jgi:hypothetical protein
MGWAMVLLLITGDAEVDHFFFFLAKVVDKIL